MLLVALLGTLLVVLFGKLLVVLLDTLFVLPGTFLVVLGTLLVVHLGTLLNDVLDAFRRHLRDPGKPLVIAMLTAPPLSEAISIQVVKPPQSRSLSAHRRYLHHI